MPEETNHKPQIADRLRQIVQLHQQARNAYSLSMHLNRKLRDSVTDLFCYEANAQVCEIGYANLVDVDGELWIVYLDVEDGTLIKLELPSFQHIESAKDLHATRTNE